MGIDGPSDFVVRHFKATPYLTVTTDPLNEFATFISWFHVTPIREPLQILDVLFAITDQAGQVMEADRSVLRGSNTPRIIPALRSFNINYMVDFYAPTFGLYKYEMIGLVVGNEDGSEVTTLDLSDIDFQGDPVLLFPGTPPTTSVPLPASFWFFITGLGLLGAIQRRHVLWPLSARSNCEPIFSSS